MPHNATRGFPIRFPSFKVPTRLSAVVLDFLLRICRMWHNSGNYAEKTSSFWHPSGYSAAWPLGRSLFALLLCCRKNGCRSSHLSCPMRCLSSEAHNERCRCALDDPITHEPNSRSYCQQKCTPQTFDPPPPQIRSPSKIDSALSTPIDPSKITAQPYKLLPLLSPPMF